MLPVAFATFGFADTPAPVSVVVRSKSFVFTAGATQSWQNLATGTRLDLGTNPLVELEIGESAASAAPVALESAQPPDVSSDGSQAVIHLKSADGALAVTVTLRADPIWPIMHKAVDVSNTGAGPTRLLNVVLGRYAAAEWKTEGGDRGFPIYVDKQFFMSLTHPAGFSHVEGREVLLRQYPGTRLEPGQSFHSMEAIFGVAKRGSARKLFVAYVRSRMARVVYGHDKPMAILDSFGGQPFGNFKNEFSTGIAESFLVDHLDQVAQSERENGVQFDYYCLEFWHERAGDLKTFNRQNFPNGFDRVRDRILELGMRPALGIDSGRLPSWTIDLNPAVAGCGTQSGDVSFQQTSDGFCRASEPIASIYREAFLYQMSENKAGLFKFDNLAAVCDNRAHNHLPGPLYSTEAIYDSLIDFMRALRGANPDVFIMLYWGYRSPWWLLYGDTYFECGEDIEAASPAQFPTPYARQSVTQRLDQAQMNITDTPWLGKDSLGVWLSDWAWNSGIGKARWQEGVVMDIARGGMLLQVWTDAGWLTPPERAQLATFIELFKANGKCFDGSRLAIGDPRKAEPYGYSCSDGKRAFLAIHNACLHDAVLNVKPGRTYGLPDGADWDVYRWYPDPAKLAADAADFKVAMRPYEVVLLEVVPHGTPPSLHRSFPAGIAEPRFSEPTRELATELRVSSSEAAPPTRWRLLRPGAVQSAKGATLHVLRDGSVLASGKNESNDTTTVTSVGDAKRITGILVEVLTDPSLPAHGPGRAVNGNLQLTDFHLSIAPGDHRAGATDVEFRSSEADFSQTSFGGWPASAVIDADPRSGWSIHPRVGQDHAVLLQLARPVEVPEGSALTFTLGQGSNGHNLGRFRISITDAASPALPSRYRAGTVALSCTVPPTKTGGLLFMAGGSPDDAPRATVGGRGVGLKSVWSTASNWGCPWTAWRAELEPSDTPRKVEIVIAGRQSQASTKFKLYYLPN